MAAVKVLVRRRMQDPERRHSPYRVGCRHVMFELHGDAVLVHGRVDVERMQDGRAKNEHRRLGEVAARTYPALVP